MSSESSPLEKTEVVEDEKKTAGISQESSGASERSDRADSQENVAAPREAETESSPSAATLKRSREEESVIDLAGHLGFKAGDRVEVEWDVTTDSQEPQSRWWGATLLEFNGDTNDSVAVRQLEYDAYPQGGFPDRSTEKVVFTGPDELVDPSTHDVFRFRREGGEETLRVGRDDIENIVNETLMRAMRNNEKSWNSLDPARQGMVASMIERKKRKLTELLTERSGKGVVTENDMKTILEETMSSS